MNPTKKIEQTTTAPKKDPKRCVETIDNDHLESVVGGFGDDGGGDLSAYPRRMATDA